MRSSMVFNVLFLAAAVNVPENASPFHGLK
jgi:hypothetical protein